MPELPEVETIVRYLRKKIINRKIISVKIIYNLIKNRSKQEFIKKVCDKKIIDIERRGKYILIVLSSKQVIRIHLRMEGKLVINDNINSITYNKHTHLLFFLSESLLLQYEDVRKFGTFELINYCEDWLKDDKFKTLGYEPFEKQCTINWINSRAKKSTKKIKNFLLDQKTILGLGNIYVDEVLFLSCIHPEKPTNLLSTKEIEQIKFNSIKVLQDAINYGGTTIRSYYVEKETLGKYQNKLLIYGKKDKKCVICGNKIVKIKVSGRGTYICKSCQKLN